MSQEIVMPKLGLIMTEGTVLEWQAKEGETVKERQVVVVIESDKTAYELESTTAGILHIVAPEGTVAPVGQLIGQIAASPEEYAKISSAKS
ncbi:MAG: hypothetical protein PHU08_02775 [Dehalococcoidales bacterium]|nr:hypothetical protein [Dehalococcoidales bacterium]